MLEVTSIALWVVVILQGLFICFLAKELAELRQSVQSGAAALQDGLPFGTKAPEFAAVSLRSHDVVHSSSLQGRRRLILLLSPDCGDCRRLTSQLDWLPQPLAAQFIVLCTGDSRRCQRLLVRAPASIPAIIAEQPDIVAAFKVRGFPALVVIDEHWRVAGHGYPHDIRDVDTILKASEQRIKDASTGTELVSLTAEAT